MNMMAPLTAVAPVLTRTEAASLVALAARTVSPLWPLESAIAVNPLSGFEELPFEEAVTVAARHFGARESLPLASWRTLLKAGKVQERALRDAAIQKLGGLNRAFELIGPDVSRLDLLMARLLHLPGGDEMGVSAHLAPDAAFIAKWCAAFFDLAQAASPMPYRDLGLYRAVLAIAGQDPEFGKLAGEAGRQLLLSVPRDPLEAIAEGLAALGVAQGEEQGRLAAYVARLPGWAGHIRWRNEYADSDISEVAPAGMADLLALWMLLERAGAVSPIPEARKAEDVSKALAAHFNLTSDMLASLTQAGRARFDEIAGMDGGALGSIFLTAAEWTYRNALMPQLQSAARAPVSAEAPEAQLVFCIDVRSEPFRKALEDQGRYETFGYAGFFGLPIALHPLGETRRKRLLPVLLSPQHDVAEGAVPGRERDAATLAMKSEQAKQTVGLFDTVKQGTATAFATAEATGPVAGLLMAARTIAPNLAKRIAVALMPPRADVLAPTLSQSGSDLHSPFTLEDKIGYALALFKLTGLSQKTARLVALVGHGGSAVNNPYSAALDCGACGGHAGGHNARILAAILNDPEVRSGMARKGVTLPESTVFIAAEHNTTTDEITLFDQADVPDSHEGDLTALMDSLAKAGAVNRERRARLLDRSAAELLTGAVHWGEIRPEWGLSGNAAFIVAPRSLTSHIDLGGRAFLHSYDWEADGEGTALATILTAPMVVAQWINCQYFFSTVDNERYGSGDKVTQNVVGGIGVVQGNGGDLRIGLPRQSLFTDDGVPFHVPQRLLTIVLAPFDRVEAVVASNDILARLFGNGWVTLVVIDPHTGKALRWRRDSELAGISFSKSADNLEINS
ncbi:DUF2309 domain-containing protein [Allosphingosinicella flava]|uniref:Probable inorganic carbon transporter subunit DabA n=1 Tax=Allosphingosinicella flava TaxID=2771430 RepID=A0A7T2GI32_9SPHN|nr:DUF2309 domain-containing protein [Sphingosinicella flava]QPQ54286.1 DUF2309 domain-containing protein [Sphingosinicella flava]